MSPNSVSVLLALPESLPPIPAHPIRWIVAGAVARLRALNLDVDVKPATAEERFLAPPGVEVIVHASADDSAEVLVFIYGDAGAAGRDVVRVDTTDAARRQIMASWRGPASLTTDNNLVALVLTRDGALRERIDRALRSESAR